MGLIVYSCWQPAGASEHTLSRASVTARGVAAVCFRLRRCGIGML
jgi:hypothetical protein